MNPKNAHFGDFFVTKVLVDNLVQAANLART